MRSIGERGGREGDGLCVGGGDLSEGDAGSRQSLLLSFQVCGVGIEREPSCATLRVSPFLQAPPPICRVLAERSRMRPRSVKTRRPGKERSQEVNDVNTRWIRLIFILT